MKKRLSGILMPITALPGNQGIGTFGKSAYEFVDFLVETKQTYWQILPLTTTSYGDSPYQSFSAIAGNTHLIDLEMLVEAGYLSADTLNQVSFGDNPEAIDYAKIYEVRRPLLEMAVKGFLSSEAGKQQLLEFENTESSWLTEYAEFMALKEHFSNKALQEWDDISAIQRTPQVLDTYRNQLADAITYHKVTQYFFFSQWQALKSFANDKGIKIIGDMPIYVSADSVEVWTQPELFKLSEGKQPLFIAGCPPDDFSDVGQLWGNPIYDWSKHAETGFAWWVYRIRESFKLYDILRIDHFKGFSDYWEIPAGSETAKPGKWVPGPGIALFEAVKKELGDLPIIAENLGYIDSKAEKLLSDTGYPGMKIMEFGFYDTAGQSVDIPHNYTANTVAYTGTHDNEVVNGWYDNLTEDQQQFVDRYLHRTEGELITQAMLRTLFASVSDTVIASMQDILDKGAWARMNTPSTVGGNWQWRMRAEDLTPNRKAFLTAITELYARTQEN